MAHFVDRPGQRDGRERSAAPHSSGVGCELPNKLRIATEASTAPHLQLLASKHGPDRCHILRGLGQGHAAKQHFRNLGVPGTSQATTKSAQQVNSALPAVVADLSHARVREKTEDRGSIHLSEQHHVKDNDLMLALLLKNEHDDAHDATVSARAADPLRPEGDVSAASNPGHPSVGLRGTGNHGEVQRQAVQGSQRRAGHAFRR
mmetsp:Transcript_39677/g.86619  ORF Transcript_39677/g.86619 Transcript_39677/m.86619 type:complete len:204 (+) Transcript_39677:739-1350(+)